MTIHIDATFAGGVFKPRQPVALTDGAEIQMTIQVGDDDDPLDEVIGVCTEGPEISLAERHDEILGGLRKDIGEDDGDVTDLDGELDDPLGAVIGIGTEGYVDGAANHDKYIYGAPRR